MQADKRGSGVQLPGLEPWQFSVHVASALIAHSAADLLQPGVSARRDTGSCFQRILQNTDFGMAAAADSPERVSRAAVRTWSWSCQPGWRQLAQRASAAPGTPQDVFRSLPGTKQMSPQVRVVYLFPRFPRHDLQGDFQQCTADALGTSNSIFF